MESGTWNVESLRDRDGDEGEAEQEHAEASERKEGSAVIERLIVVLDGRMPDSDEKRRDQSENRPRQAAEGARGGEPDDDQRDQGLAAADSRAQNVPAVKLPDRQKIQGGNEEAEPGRHENRMLVHSKARIEAGAGPFLRQVDHHGVVEQDGPVLRRSRDRLCARDSIEKKRQRHEKPGQRAGGSHVDQFLLATNGFLDADQSAESADQIQKGGRNKVGERGGQSVTTAHHIVSELMHPEDQEKRDRERKAVGKGTFPQQASAHGEASARNRRRDERGHQEREMEEGVFRETKPGRPPACAGRRLGILDVPAVVHAADVISRRRPTLAHTGRLIVVLAPVAERGVSLYLFGLWACRCAGSSRG